MCPGQGPRSENYIKMPSFCPGTMSLLDLFRNEYVHGKVVNKYRLENGNLGLIVEFLISLREIVDEGIHNASGNVSEYPSVALLVFFQHLA